MKSFLGYQDDPLPPSTRNIGIVDRVRQQQDQLRDWFTEAELAERIGISGKQANTVIYNLLHQGELERGPDQTRGRRGRPQCYRWKHR